jgi:hypothetical protein
MSKKEKILKRLQRGEILTQLDVTFDPEIKCTRLSPRIGEIEAMGFLVDRTMINRGGIRYMSYRLIRTEPSGQVLLTI